MYKTLLLFLLFMNFKINAQNTDIIKTLNVFVDCSNYEGDCQQAYLRQELSGITFVRDRLDADVHIIIKANWNNAGIQTNSLFVIGQKKFSSIQDTINYVIPANSTEQETREVYTKNIKIALLPYLAKTTLVNNIDISFTQNEDDKKSDPDKKDPYNYWVFQLGVNGSMSGNQVYKEISGSGYATANRETDISKSNIYFNTNEQYSKYRDIENNKTYIYEYQDFATGGSYMKKVSDHIGLGAQLDFKNSIFSNLKYQYTAGPLAEYSFFNYKDFNTRRLIFQYSIDARHNTYYDTTIYFKTKEMLFAQEASLIGSFTQKWGSINAGIFWRNLFRDFTKNSLGFNGAFTARLFKGLNFAIWGNYSFIRNQLNIRKGDASIDQLLAKNREILSAYDYSLGIGLSFRFGSKFNSAVNPTFRGLSYNISL